MAEFDSNNSNRRNIVRRLCAAMMAGVLLCLCACGSDGGQSMKGNYKNSKSLISSAIVNEEGMKPYGENYPAEYDGLYEDGEKMVDAQIKLFKALANGRENSMISPISIIYALGMVESGAKGKTLEEMEALFGLDRDTMTRWLAAWRENFAVRYDVKVNLANALWFREGKDGGGGFEPNAEYLKALANYFKAQAYSSDFSGNTVDDINAWCDDNTFGMIDKIIDRIDSSEMAILLNAIAFEGKWVKEYGDEAVMNEKFYAMDGTVEDAKLMYSKEDLYYEDEYAVGFMKPYEGGYSYMAILPKEGMSVEQYMEKLDGDRLIAFMDSAKPAVVNSYLPKYKSEYKRDDVKDVLGELGLSAVFNPDEADLSGMGKSSMGNLYVGDVIHKTFIEVDEKGTKAAAVTKVGLKGMALAPTAKPEYTVKLDRPFLYAIVEDGTGTPVFIGTVTSVAGR